MRLAITKRIPTDIKEDIKDMCTSVGIDYIGVGLEENIDEILNTCDGLLVPGGVDVNPNLYNQKENGYLKSEYGDQIDKIDYKWIIGFSDNNKPIIGICRGIQVINVFFGGTLLQDIKGHTKEYGHHNIDLIKDGFVYDCYKKDVIEVNTYHHEVIDKLADGFKAVAYSTKEKYIEAIEGKNIYAVQWHPERDGNNVFIEYIKKLIK